MGIFDVVFGSAEAALPAEDALDMTNISGPSEEYGRRARSDGNGIWCERMMQVMMYLIRRRPFALDADIRQAMHRAVWPAPKATTPTRKSGRKGAKANVAQCASKTYKIVRNTPLARRLKDLAGTTSASTTSGRSPWMKGMERRRQRRRRGMDNDNSESQRLA